MNILLILHEFSSYEKDEFHVTKSRNILTLLGTKMNLEVNRLYSNAKERSDDDVPMTKKTARREFVC